MRILLACASRAFGGKFARPTSWADPGQRAKLVRAELRTDVDVMALLRGIVSSRLSISGHSSQESKLNSSLCHDHR